MALTVLLVTNEQFRDEDMETIRSGPAQRLGDGIDIQIDRVDRIPPEASGKFRYVVSKVAV